jgi:hypothetical protein
LTIFWNFGIPNWNYDPIANLEFHFFHHVCHIRRLAQPPAAFRIQRDADGVSGQDPWAE